MDRRVLITGLFGVAGAAALAAALPPQAKALSGLPPKDSLNQSNVLPDLEELANPEDIEGPEEGVQLAQYYRRRRRRRRRWRWRRYCRRYWWGGGFRRRCWRRRVWYWI